MNTEYLKQAHEKIPSIPVLVNLISKRTKQLIARACESGSVAMIKQPFMRPSQNRVKNKALDAMRDTADKELKKLTGG